MNSLQYLKIWLLSCFPEIVGCSVESNGSTNTFVGTPFIHLGVTVLKVLGLDYASESELNLGMLIDINARHLLYVAVVCQRSLHYD